jgi:TatD DNase family protein
VIDTHAHLDACADPPDALVARAEAAGVDRILTVGTTIERCREALAQAERHSGVFAILGAHPHEAGGDAVDRLDELRGLLGHPRAVAVGETGLDHYRDYAPRNRQRELFDAQLALAAELGLPVVVHTRAAEDETLAALEAFTGDVVLHCFSSARLLPPALERGWYVSFAGNVTYKNASELRVAASQVPADRILAETDCPYLSPEPRRGRPNEPANVVHTVAALAAARREETGELAARIDENAARVFRLP